MLAHRSSPLCPLPARFAASRLADRVRGLPSLTRCTSIPPAQVPAGSDIFIATWNLHRSPTLWDRPEVFDPDRFGPLDAPGPNEYTEGYRYLPFGGGQRTCIGDQFALFESVTAMCARGPLADPPADPASSSALIWRCWLSAS